MNDIEIINQIEKLVNSKLKQRDHVSDYSEEYSINQSGHVTGLSLTRDMINDKQSRQLIYLLGNLKNLTNLNISGVPTLVCTSLKEIKSLTKLTINSCDLSDISPLKELTGITSLDFYGNQINDISPLKELAGLKSLNLSGNQINDISPLKELTGLTSLDLSLNQISDISPLKELTGLLALNLSDNQISDISPLKNLQALQRLILSDNKIENLPSWITQFRKGINIEKNVGDGVFLNNNPITTPPIEIIKQGDSALKRYFEKIETEGIDYIYEAKLTLVGEGASGKTSLQLRLLDSKALLPKEEERTRGIKIEEWNFKNDANKNNLAHIWDFGGQDVYYPVHRFFLTENSVFVLLASTRMTQHNFDYWIPTIYQFGGKSPIILGQTCHKGNKVSWNDIGVFLSNNNFTIIRTDQIPYYHLNLLNDNEGLENLKEAIIEQILKLPHYGKGVPKSWIPVREELMKISKKTDCISYERFQAICRHVHPEEFKKPVSIEDCGIFFHSIGIVLWYHNYEELRNSVILKPEWAMNAVYKLIDDGEIQNRHGIILQDDFDRLWNDGCYTGHHQVLKKMLEVFRIAFCKKHAEEYIIPARLLSMPDTERWKDDESYLRLNYKYEFMPKGMVNQLSAELSRYIPDDNHVWNNAVNFCFTNFTAKCQVEEDFYNREIRIKTKGKDARALNMLIMDVMQNITDGYKGVKPQIKIPCNCEKCRKNENPQVFSYEMLLQRYSEKEKARVMCNASEQMFLIEDFLFDAGIENPIKEEKDKEQNKSIRIFITSSSELKDDRKELELAIRQRNDLWLKNGIYLKPVMWENFIDAMSQNRLQEEYNKAVRECDIFVMLFFTKVGQYTAEEFENAFGHFRETGKPLVYTYFKNAPILTGDLNRKDASSLFAFQEKLKKLEHYKTEFTNPQGLILHFFNQLESLKAGGKI